MSPDDPRYGRPAYSNAPPVPTGPVMSPDDPRYGRPAGPPAVIYADRPPASAPPAYDNRIPGAGVVRSNEDALRPPEGDRRPCAHCDRRRAAAGRRAGADGKPLQLSALPPEEQPEVGPAQLPPHLRRQEVAFATKEPAGTIVVDTPNTYLYYVLGDGRAVRYGVRVGRDGFTWTGVQKITKKTEWPDWYPPTEMIERQPYLPRFMAGGNGNPLGARAMYLGSTVYRIHGTNQPSTIGKFVSSGCIGMLNEDVSDLFERTKVGTRVVVMPGGPPPGTATASAAPAPGPLPRGAPAQARCRRPSRHAADRGAAAAGAGHGALGPTFVQDRSIARSVATKQSALACVATDCFASLAMTVERRDSSRQPLLRLALEPGVDAFDHLAVVIAKAVLGDVAEMRRQHEVVELAERMIDRQRLDREHVDAGARDLLLLSALPAARPRRRSARARC